MKNLTFLAVGIAVGFVLANALERARQAEQNPDELADQIQKDLEVLEGQMA
ncbi:MAG: hypothetical protein ACKVQS_08885 [Fimbriimonadaceae bacterium]